MKLDWNWTLSLEEALANGPAGIGGTGGILADRVEVLLGIVGIGNGRSVVGLIVACILASEEAVGAYNLEDEIELVGFGRDSASAGGGGAALTFFRISA